ncbi:EamA family transporter RarD [Histidinibacterium aquaticum]|uniref:EamA family transporter RarD n=1 Tax=Histidinibacterium aquaticum TaxID=2613962 RepID=A0A5J5GMC8_9RHOB|nr:EamA family transporter RarD [Histidinibacterium aquaticum]KAA9009320.1 EamA family transporter RarD [Histidinibacterium aquaticum]
MTEAKRGIAAMIAACTIWGLSPLFYKQLDHIPPGEVLAYRTLWSFVFFAGVLALQGRLRVLGEALSTPRRALLIFASGFAIGCNWFGFIFAVHSDRALEASLGYYIFPLTAVLFGRLIFGERLSGAQWAAVALAAAAVATLTAGLGVPPWISLALAGTFAVYGILKKQLPAGPVVSVTAEVLLLSPIGIAWIVWAGTSPDAVTHLWLAASGPLTATPLILFSYAAKRARLSTVGLVQYLNPTLQFACATLVFLEPVTRWHAIAFPGVWLALAVYSASALAQDRSARRAASRASTPGTSVT